MANGSIEVQVDVLNLEPVKKLHEAVCQAVALLNRAPELARSTEGREAHNLLRQALVDFADAYMDEPVTESERAAVAAKKLRERVAGVAKERAVVIVRTELVTAANYGSLMGAQATGLRLEKFWIATKDGRTRPTHSAIDSVGAPLQDGIFSVGGAPARYPGDPILPVGERVNCRCSIGYRKPA